MTYVFEDEDFVVVTTESNNIKVTVEDGVSRTIVSPNGTRYLLCVNDDGTLFTIPAP